MDTPHPLAPTQDNPAWWLATPEPLEMYLDGLGAETGGEGPVFNNDNAFNKHRKALARGLAHSLADFGWRIKKKDGVDGPDLDKGADGVFPDMALTMVG